MREWPINDPSEPVIREGLEQFDLLFRKGVDLRAANRNHPYGDTLAQQRRREHGAMAEAFLAGHRLGKLSLRLRRTVQDVHRLPVDHRPPSYRPPSPGGGLPPDR